MMSGCERDNQDTGASLISLFSLKNSFSSVAHLKTVIDWLFSPLIGFIFIYFFLEQKIPILFHK
jgi:hypothetical protein